jgi:uncharacterized membrane protein (UPF0127 family)
MNKRSQVIAVIKNLKPNRLTWFYPKAASVLELPAGTVDATGTKIGDKLEIA